MVGIVLVAIMFLTIGMAIGVEIAPCRQRGVGTHSARKLPASMHA